MAFFYRKTYCIITGASSGLGQELATQLSKLWSNSKTSCEVVLVSRNIYKLNETKKKILAGSMSMGSFITVKTIQADLSNMDTLSCVTDEILNGYDPSHYDQAALFHVAGSIGDIVKSTAEQIDPFKVSEYLTLNYTSMWMLTNKFLSTVKDGPRIVMNMTSLLAKKPLGGLAAYSSIKAARNIYLESVAIEYPDVRFLNYSPGPCDTDMFRYIRDNISFDQSKAAFVNMKDFVLSTEKSIGKLIQIISDDQYESGTTIDYFD
jgi:sepiapterin reductase